MYAGEAAGYLITDDTEKAFIASGAMYLNGTGQVRILREHPTADTFWAGAAGEKGWEMEICQSSEQFSKAVQSFSSPLLASL